MALLRLTINAVICKTVNKRILFRFVSDMQHFRAMHVFFSLIPNAFPWIILFNAFQKAYEISNIPFYMHTLIFLLVLSGSWKKNSIVVDCFAVSYLLLWYFFVKDFSFVRHREYTIVLQGIYYCLANCLSLYWKLRPKLLCLETSTIYWL